MTQSLKNSQEANSPLTQQALFSLNEIPLYDAFPSIDTIIASFRSPEFLALSVRKRFRTVNRALYDLIQEAPAKSFLLGAVLAFMDRINREKVLNEPLNMASFEFWLNNFSDLSDHDNYETRAKIAGRWIPRGDYQAFFPIGMDRVYTGSHFVAAHLSPDVDTMVASFWGWVDAFAARVGSGLHLWCLPGGPPDSPVTSIINEMFGPGLFTSLPRTAQTLTLTAMDMVTQKLLTKEVGGTLTGTIDHGSNEKAVILIDDNGHYLGDWRSSDVEIVRQIIILFKSCLRWFENNLHTRLITLFAKIDLSVKDFPAFNSSVFDVKIKDCEPALEFNEKQKNDLQDFFCKILGVEKGLNGTFGDLIHALHQLSISELAAFQQKVESLPTSDIFDEQGKLKEDRPKIFHRLEKIINHLDAAIHNVRNYVERLDIVLGIKHKVLGFPLLYINLRSDVDEMRHKMQNYDFLTVVIPEKNGSLFPVGIVRAGDLRMTGLGTVSLRDFCNLEEVKMASYLEVISVVDHHKSSLKTLSVPSALIGDAQSCNVLLAEQAFLINDHYSLGGMTPEQIESHIQAIASTPTNPSQIRILQRLLQRRMAAHRTDAFYVHPKREFQEYLSYLHAILDDTDLLTKVSNRDLNCVAQLLNRLKSLSVGYETEIIHFDDIPKNKAFTKIAAQRILQQEDMYSLYKKIYDFRETSVEDNLALCISGHYSNIFLDAKEQNGCARVGQTKIFASNFNYFLDHAQEIRSIWLNKSQEVNQEHPEIDLHIHMISTIASAEEVYRNMVGPHPHSDELWFWIPETQQGNDHLNSFLAGFQYAVKGIKDSMEIDILGSNAHDFIQAFSQYFPEVPRKVAPNTQEGMPIAVLRFKAGALNSRKSMITPFLPRLIS
ncbi:hypothetical protein PNK_0406 [Candidatus Protochlamydia naegleriophila]|uniref:Uncharacterized protein n=1 Tax=Candidatus Protochlamydia naegleriophila TaxID=389348 RepID=A0A0U5JE41_9BACT|nr:hypothetical protein [Candidatus Protochlamydia naegleriophila]CUI16038.1 hypothetical protein PNK_0406 [Candidatus Protochlamydia naegleriophila]